MEHEPTPWSELTKEERRERAEQSRKAALQWYAERGLEPLVLSLDMLGGKGRKVTKRKPRK